MQELFFQIVGISITTSIVIVILMLSSSIINERYKVKWRYYVWILLAVRLILPINFGITEPPIELSIPNIEVSYGVNDKRLPDLTPLVEPSEIGTSKASDLKKSSYREEINRYGEGVSSNEGELIQSRKEATGTITISQIIGAIYFAGVGIFLITQLGIYLLFRRTTKRWYQDIGNHQVLDTFQELKASMSILKPLGIKVCKKISSPMIVGLRKPTLLLPHERYQNIDLEIIIKHELIHFKRNDLWVKFLLICVNAVHWFNPVIYLMIREANKDIEIACDEEVLKDADAILRKRYSERILELMQMTDCKSAPISTSFHGGKDMMKDRIKNIFDMRQKKKGFITIVIILTAVVVGSACQIEALANLRIPLTTIYKDAYGYEEDGTRSDTMWDFAIEEPFDLNQDGIEESKFLLEVSNNGEECYLVYEKDWRRLAKTQIFKGVDPGIDYGIQVANVENFNSITILVSINYRGMPFGAGYWEMYTWKNGKFKQVDLDPVKENLVVQIATPSEIQSNYLDAGVITYLQDYDKKPKTYPAAALYFRNDWDDKEKQIPKNLIYAPLSEYDVEGYKNWGQKAINKSMTDIKLVNGEIHGIPSNGSLAVLETEEVVFVTLPNPTATLTSYYQYENGKWNRMDGFIK